eukprot:365402-Chlamydomonas_euryale.AAC.2
MHRPHGLMRRPRCSRHACAAGRPRCRRRRRGCPTPGCPPASAPRQTWALRRCHPPVLAEATCRPARGAVLPSPGQGEVAEASELSSWAAAAQPAAGTAPKPAPCSCRAAPRRADRPSVSLPTPQMDEAVQSEAAAAAVAALSPGGAAAGRTVAGPDVWTLLLGPTLTWPCRYHIPQRSTGKDVHTTQEGQGHEQPESGYQRFPPHARGTGGRGLRHSLACTAAETRISDHGTSLLRPDNLGRFLKEMSPPEPSSWYLPRGEICTSVDLPYFDLLHIAINASTDIASTLPQLTA